MPTAPTTRVRRLNADSIDPSGDYVLYWMVASRRPCWNHALDAAIDHARILGKPLIVFEPLNVDYRWANDRHHLAIIDGMLEQSRAFADSPVAYLPWVEPTPGAGRGLLEALAARASVVVTDDSPTFFTPRLLEAAKRAVPCRAEAVDSCGLMPLRATDRTFGAAYHFRRYLHKNILDHLGARPDPDPLTTAAQLRTADLPDDVLARWPSALHDLFSRAASKDGTANAAEGSLSTQADMVRAIARLPIDHSVGPTGWRGGHTAARARLEAFLDDGLDRYAEERNDPDSGAASELSPALHYGHISVHEVFDAVTRREGWSPNRIDPPPNGRRAGWWGMSPSAESFIDQIVTWREVGFGYCAHQPDYSSFDTLSEWAIQTLEEHASDPREWVYSLDDFASASTHDEIWNAAQRQLVGEGVIHNYLRMLWGKKILEWTAHPRDALDIMVELNNRYALDGRDPNSWTGIMWTLGRFDRGWPERAIYGKVRSMSSDSTLRKVKLDRYLARWGEQGELL